ncbi:hypothetical protein BIV57_02625 [Mangrovactinospora gilvigrisea]|uniref:ABC3 transporter permease C-terminal domain-containing protein n=1 Tax=Mangrovactinospora gilvigrisea TaxID=1428644 RepID=A0A1J7BK06_9ACTN|nr:FtsX-like permease family protein [Mangrovactinospora gilvigrisea]OIV39019.1 hypothetical protein BIV57_02625 [Mangrovactinospora gilvigrisea]
MNGHRLADLALGWRLAFSGGREGLARTLLTGFGVAIGIATLLFAASVPGVIADNHQRLSARNQHAAPHQLTPTDRTAVSAMAGTTFRNSDIGGQYLQADGDRPPTPPGLRTFPHPGEMFTSPELHRLLHSPQGALLRARFAQYREVGTVEDAGLRGPRELFYYAGTDRLTVKPDGNGTGVRVDAFGEAYSGWNVPALVAMLVTVAAVVLLAPVAIFLATAIRFGGERRDRRLADFRLAGATRAQIARIAAGETLGGTVLGLAIGWGLFLALRQLVPHLTLFGESAFPGAVAPDWRYAVGIMLAVPLLAVGVALVTMRRITVEPLGVVRRGGPARRRLWWRLLLPLLGGVLLARAHQDSDFLASGGSLTRVALGVLAVLVGLSVLLPWCVEMLVRGLGPRGPLSWQLALRRLQLGGDGAARGTAGIAVAVAGAVALQSLMGLATNAFTVRPATAGTSVDSQIDIGATAMRGHTPAAITARLDAVPGVHRAVGALEYETYRSTKDDDVGRLTVADCTQLVRLLRIDSCRDGQVFFAPQQYAGKQPATGTALRLGAADGPRWPVPSGVTAAHRRSGGYDGGLIATPGALHGLRLGHGDYRAWVTNASDARRLDTIDRVRNAVEPLGYGADVMDAQVDVNSGTFDFGAVRTGILVAITLTLLVVGAGLSLSSAEQTRERRRVLAALAATGVRRRTLLCSVLWQAAVPMAVGTALAAALGMGLGVTLVWLSGSQRTVPVPWQDLAVVTGLGAAVVLAVTACTLPLLTRAMRAEGLRTE